MATVMNTRKVLASKKKLTWFGKKKKKDTAILIVSEAVETIRVANRFYEARRNNNVVSQIVHIEGHLKRVRQATESRWKSGLP